MLWILWSLLEILRFAVKFVVFMDCFGELSPRKDDKEAILRFLRGIVGNRPCDSFFVKSPLESSSQSLAKTVKRRHCEVF